MHVFMYMDRMYVHVCICIRYIYYVDKEFPTFSALTANFFLSLSDKASMGFTSEGPASSAAGASANRADLTVGVVVGGRAADSE